MNIDAAALKQFFFRDDQREWLVRGPAHPLPERRAEHVEVLRLLGPDGEAIYSKRFLKRPNGADYGYWTRRELRFVSHFGAAATPGVVQPAALVYGKAGIERVDTQDAGPSVEDWQNLIASPPGQAGPCGGLFDDAFDLALLLRACLLALQEIHVLGIVHCDLKPDNLCLGYFGDPLGAAGIRLDYRSLRIIDFAFSVWPGANGWALALPLPIDPKAGAADYLSPYFRQILREDRSQARPTAWTRLDYGVDLYALGAMLRKLLADRDLIDPLAVLLDGLAAEWMARYAEAPASGEPPHADCLARLEVELLLQSGGAADWTLSRPFAPCQVRGYPATPATPLASPGMASTGLVENHPEPPVVIPAEPSRRLPCRWLLGCGLLALAGAGYVAATVWPQPAPPVAGRIAATASACRPPPWTLQASSVSPALESPVSALAYSPDAQTLAAGLRDGRLALWQTAWLGSAPRLAAAHAGSVKALAFSPDGSLLASGGSDKTARRWALPTLQALGPTLAGHGDKVIAAAFTADGRELNSFGSDGSLRRWDAQTGAALGQSAQGVAVSAAAFAPGGRHLATGKADGEVGVWGIASGESVGDPQRGHAQAATALAFSPDGSLLVSGGWDRRLRRWDARSGQPVGAALPPLPGPPAALAFAPGGLSFAAADLDGHLSLFDSASGCLLAQTRLPESAAALAFGADGKTLAVGGEGRVVREWRVVAE